MARKSVRAEARARYYIREEARKRGWDTSHVSAGGNFLEENEILAHFPDIGLGQDKPDFLLCLGGEPVIVIEAKNTANKIDTAIQEAIDYAETINSAGRYTLRIAVGAAGEDDTGFTVEVRFLSANGWVPLVSKQHAITTIPSIRETELALSASDGTTSVTVPAVHEFIDAAIELSSLLRTAKVEAPLRPKVIGAVVLGMYEGQIDVVPERALAAINHLVETAIARSSDLTDATKGKLIDALRLSGADFDRLAPSINRVVNILRRLNVRAVLHTDTDFLGMFYEAFLRYGYDNNALGIVFTPRHITRFCIDLLGAGVSDNAIDIACGTGGFLVAAFDKMMSSAKSAASVNKVKSSLYGFDTNPMVWALAMLNLMFRGDGKSHVNLGNCFDKENRELVAGRFSRAFLNPPFSQEGEPEKDFIDASMNALAPEGMLAAVVYAGVFADEEHAHWRKAFLQKHTLLGMISLPEDLFYPTAAPTSIILAQAHVPQPSGKPAFMARVWNDGYEKLKNRRVERGGSQLPEIRDVFRSFLSEQPQQSPIATIVPGSAIKDGNEWSPQQWLPQPPASLDRLQQEQEEVIRAIYQAVAQMPELADEALATFTSEWSHKPELPLNNTGMVSDFFDVVNGRSVGEKNYPEGACAYVSSKDTTNSIVRLVEPTNGERFQHGGMTVTAFGNAAIQPWPFVGRGNGGSSVRILLPRYNMSFRELVWFAAQINVQKWRFFYARMAIKSRLIRLEIAGPPARYPDSNPSIAENITNFRRTLGAFSHVDA